MSERQHPQQHSFSNLRTEVRIAMVHRQFNPLAKMNDVFLHIPFMNTERKIRNGLYFSELDPDSDILPVGYLQEEDTHYVSDEDGDDQNFDFDKMARSCAARTLMELGVLGERYAFINIGLFSHADILSYLVAGIFLNEPLVLEGEHRVTEGTRPFSVALNQKLVRECSYPRQKQMFQALLDQATVLRNL